MTSTAAENGNPIQKRPSRRTTKAPVVLESTTNPKKPLLKQGTTWAGIFSIAAAIATGGASVLTDPQAISAIGAGIALLFAEN